MLLQLGRAGRLHWSVDESATPRVHTRDSFAVDSYAMNLDPHTPVIVGVGQAAEHIDDPEYRAMSAVELAAAAARAAVHDCDADFAAVSAAIDTALSR